MATTKKAPTAKTSTAVAVVKKASGAVVNIQDMLRKQAESMSERTSPASGISIRVTQDKQFSLPDGQKTDYNRATLRKDGERVVYANSEQTFTYAGIGVFSPAFFAGVQPGTIMKLRPLLDAAISAGTLTGERFAGRWVDVGTPQRLAELDTELRDQELKNA